MKFIYLIQGDEYRLPYSLPKSSEYLLLNWSAKSAGENPASEREFYFPNSTWAEGRNELYRRARLLGEFDYYVFCDDDLKLNFSLDHFEFLTRKYKPARLAPTMQHKHDLYTKEPTASLITALKYIDHCFMALSTQAANELIPYTTEFDQTCWWKSSEEFCERSWEAFPFQTYKLNELSVKNLQNRPYPKNRLDVLPSNQFRVVKVKFWRWRSPKWLFNSCALP